MADPLRGKRELQEARARLGEIIEDKMHDLRIRSLQDFADHVGIGRSTLYEIVRGRSKARGIYAKPSFDTMIVLAKALDVPLHELVYLIEPHAPGAEEIVGPKTAPPLKRLDVKVAGWVATASRVNEDDGDLDESIWVEEKFAKGKALAAFKIHGDSMAGGRHPIYHGDIVIVNRKDKGRNNTPVVARLVNNHYVCKLLKEGRFSHSVKLASANPEHLNGTPTAVPPEDVAEIVGKVVRVIHDEVDDEAKNPAAAAECR